MPAYNEERAFSLAARVVANAPLRSAVGDHNKVFTVASYALIH